MTAPVQIHATVVAIGEAGIVLRGVAGIGKSDLALRLLDRGALLVADDRVNLERRQVGRDQQVIASSPPRIAGWLHVAGVGPLPFACRPDVPVMMLVDLLHDPPRQPVDNPMEPLLGVPVRRVGLDPRAASAPIVIERLLHALDDGNDAPLAG